MQSYKRGTEKVLEMLKGASGVGAQQVNTEHIKLIHTEKEGGCVRKKVSTPLKEGGQ